MQIQNVFVQCSHYSVEEERDLYYPKKSINCPIITNSLIHSDITCIAPDSKRPPGLLCKLTWNFWDIFPQLRTFFDPQNEHSNSESPSFLGKLDKCLNLQEFFMPKSDIHVLFLWFWERSSSSNFRWYPFFNFRHSRAENFDVKMYERNGEFPDSFSSSSIDMNCSWNMTRSVLILMLSHLDLILIMLTICCYKYLAATLCSKKILLTSFNAWVFIKNVLWMLNQSWCKCIF